jgi:hypothetical protein
VLPGLVLSGKRAHRVSAPINRDHLRPSAPPPRLVRRG